MSNVNPAPFVLASLLTGYPVSSLEEAVQLLLSDEKVVLPLDIKELIRKKTLDANIDDLRSEYIDIFDRGQNVNSPHETEYGHNRSMVKGSELSDIAGFYQAFGFVLDEERPSKEMLDHISVELEFYALLLFKQAYLQEMSDPQGAEIVEDARRKFLMDHLGRFVESIANRPGVQESEFYRSVYGFVQDLVSQECAQLQVQAAPIHWNEKDRMVEEMQCGVANSTAN